MTAPGDTPPTNARSGRIAALRDNYGRVRAPKPKTGERRPWYKLKRPDK